jgi:putative ABC transport system ATP-binding protein
MVNNPAVILADEATVTSTVALLLRFWFFFNSFTRKEEPSFFVTHNPEIAQYSSRNIVLRDGQVKEDKSEPFHPVGCIMLASLPLPEEL